MCRRTLLHGGINFQHLVHVQRWPIWTGRLGRCELLWSLPRRLLLHGGLAILHAEPVRLRGRVLPLGLLCTNNSELRLLHEQHNTK
jgi:hypothetical protein